MDEKENIKQEQPNENCSCECKKEKDNLPIIEKMIVEAIGVISFIAASAMVITNNVSLALFFTFLGLISFVIKPSEKFTLLRKYSLYALIYAAVYCGLRVLFIRAAIGWYTPYLCR